MCNKNLEATLKTISSVEFETFGKRKKIKYVNQESHPVMSNAIFTQNPNFGRACNGNCRVFYGHFA
jgi:hypothetical protein